MKWIDSSTRGPTDLLSFFLLHLSVIEKRIFKSSVVLIIYLVLFSFLSISASYNLRPVFMCIHILNYYAVLVILPFNHDEYLFFSREVVKSMTIMNGLYLSALGTGNKFFLCLEG